MKENNEIVSFKIAKLAKDKGFEENTLGFYYEEELCNVNIGKLGGYDSCYYNPLPFDKSEQDRIIPAPTYFELINWIFNANIAWLELWYDQLKDCPLKYEFKGRLLSWIRQNKYMILETPTIADNTFSIYKWEYGKGWQCLTTVDYFESEYLGILEIFKLLKNKNNE